MLVEIHVLQNLAPSNLNRDEAGIPKSGWLGGVPRQRVSSQAWKRACRDRFNQTLDPTHRAYRTRLLLRAVLDRLPEADPKRVAEVLPDALAPIKVADGQTSYLLFLSETELTALAQSVDGLLQGKKPQSLPAILARGKAVDLALFGRMVADVTSAQVEAATHFAHPISTNMVPSTNIDYFTAIDDLQSADQAGAAMVGQTEFMSSCLYRYASLDYAQLLSNLQGDETIAREAVTVFLDAMVHAMPSGKQHSFATFTPPSLLLGVVRSDGQRWQLCNAFAQPCRATKEQHLIDASAEALDRHWSDVAQMYGTEDIARIALARMGQQAMPSLDAHRVKTAAEWSDVLTSALSSAMA